MSKEQPIPLTFIVNSGRCGSTMLSRILHRHPDVLSASEFMNTMRRAMDHSLFAQPEVSGEALWDAPEEFRSLLAPPRDMDRFMSYPIPVYAFGDLWSGMMSEGADQLSKMPREYWTVLRYEKLVADPRAELTRLAEFIGTSTTSQWLDEACGIIKSGSTGTAAAQLDPDTLAALRAACEPGEKILTAMETEYAAP